MKLQTIYFIFESSEPLNPLMSKLLSHSIMTGTYDRVLKYMGIPVKENGQLYHLANPELLTIDITRKDKALLKAISDPIFNTGSITNKAL